MKRSPDERHTLTQGSLTETFWQSQTCDHQNDAVKLPCV